jgi:hypothetical protein
MDPLYLSIQRLIGVILGILLFYSAFKLLKVLQNKEVALSMVFLNQKRIINLFGLVVIAAFFTFLTGLDYVFLGNSISVEILLDLNALTLLIFTFLLQKLMSGDENKWT